MTFAETLLKLWPHGDEKIPGLRAGMIATAPAVFQKYGITTPLLVAHVMAQISHECGAGHDVVENLSYSAERLIEVWPRHFNGGNASSYAHNPQKLADFIYNPPQHKDLGNREGTDDGWNFRGRGAAQTTGRFGYQELANKTGLDLLNHPDLINDPQHFMECGVADFIICGCLPYAKADDVVNVTKRLNGGTVGLDQRIEWLSKWKSANVVMGPVIMSKPVTLPQPGSPKPTVILPKPPSITNPAPGSIGAFIASLFSKIFGKKS